MSRNYSSIASEKQLTSNVSNVATQITLDNATGLPSPPFILVLNPDTNIEEIVLVDADQTGVTSPTFKVTRAQDGTIAQTHTQGQSVRHMIVGSDLQTVSTHVDATAAHGATGAIVGTTNTQTLTNKTLTSPKINENVVLTATSTELNYVDGVTSAIQTQIDSKKDKLASVNAQTGTTYTFVLADADKIVTSSNSSSVTFTIPPQSSVTWATNTILNVINYGTGVVTIAGGVGVTVTNTANTLSQYQGASIVRTGSDAWTIVPLSGGVNPLSDSNVTGTTGSPSTATYSSGGINYKTYTFTGSGSITFNRAGLIDILVVGGGGSGGLYGGTQRGGGGGAGMYLRKDGVYMESATANVYIGGGGSASSEGLSRNGNPGFASGISVGTDYLYVAIGGGYGCGDTGTGGSGGSGGGSSTAGTGGGSALLSGGNAGGNDTSGSGGGGGGASQAGQVGSTNVGGAGGNGTATTIRAGSSVTYAGGGGGAGTNTAGAGGSGGGGTGTGAGSANTGGGGGGGGTNTNGGAGGSGIVVIRVRA